MRVWSEVWPPVWRRFWYIRSSNTARLRLKPVVPTLARLLATTSSCICWASRPVLAMERERIMGKTPGGWPGPCSCQVGWQGVDGESAVAQQLVGLLVVAFGCLKRLHLHLKASCIGNHVNHGLHCIDVA